MIKNLRTEKLKNLRTGILLFFSFSVFSFFSSSVLLFAQPVSSSELINNAKQYDGKIVTYSGEVIGDVMLRGEFAWVNINDGKNALGVWMSAALAQEIKFTGNYKARGDRLEIVGVFHHACPEHGGDLDIHGRFLRKIASGRMVKEKLNFDKVSLIFILLGVLFLTWILTLFKRK
ncbi:MAG: DNA-binding protein [Candidatus Omnitrophica bacterium]|nr:DNA-binding protein [Candidatus Omnitrophota bacterium]MBU4303038.1 DNA-binding protein [Candidatus Omnitrophota bacterium]MBU4467257.1 DNA-binding protein [Candidatus Omnitrophota bacterium]MCG2707377.1 DNA-binding protein [Candidatus Omnitrophota bacterium]